ncbi:hypothetical protein N7478_012016 [Penicillium angulare]|uniref:uncharacterized protein n=1 Tax=Penicillium angulare TaxID=116970 RepID=UPI00254061B6|nr:uncharacterized protein N7478_012016 [Penicillium angulare]KAJ5261421.1 hypothetical protein N7478_012016 [Penicillium angulare]
MHSARPYNGGEESLDKWDLLPQHRGEDALWRDDFKAKQALEKARGFNMWMVKQSVDLALRDGTSMKARLWGESQHQSEFSKAAKTCSGVS